MSFYRILVEPAKSSKGKCKTCGLDIAKDAIRVHVRDDREFQNYIKNNGGFKNYTGEGLHRGYI